MRLPSQHFAVAILAFRTASPLTLATPHRSLCWTRLTKCSCWVAWVTQRSASASAYLRVSKRSSSRQPGPIPLRSSPSRCRPSQGGTGHRSVRGQRLLSQHGLRRHARLDGAHASLGNDFATHADAVVGGRED
eukprot:scaffold93329_cov32-Tisochrysis_lutea.AAC.2